MDHGEGSVPRAEMDRHGHFSIFFFGRFSTIFIDFPMIFAVVLDVFTLPTSFPTPKLDPGTGS